MRLVRRAGDHDQVGRAHLARPGRRPSGRCQSSSAGAEVGQVDDQVGLGAGQLAGDVAARRRACASPASGCRRRRRRAARHDAARGCRERHRRRRARRRGAGAATGRARPGSAARPRRTSRPPPGAGSRRGRTRRCRRRRTPRSGRRPRSWLPTSAVPAPPRTRPTPAHRFGWISRPSLLPPFSSSIRRWPSDSLRRSPACTCAIVARRSMPASSRSASAQASSAVSRVMVCSRMPKRSSRPCVARRARGSTSTFSATAAGGSPQVR